MRGDTIYALSSAPGRAGVAVVRVSGANAAAAVRALTRKPLPQPRKAVLTRFFDASGAAIDGGLLLFFLGPASFTGEDMAEFQVHGGRAIVEALLGALARHALAAPARLVRLQTA